MAVQTPEEAERAAVLKEYRQKVLQHRETDSKLKAQRSAVKDLVAKYEKTEEDLGALQSVGQIIGDVLKAMPPDHFIVKASSGPRYVVGCRTRLEKSKLKVGTRVALDMTTLTIMRVLPREVDPTVFHMQSDEVSLVKNDTKSLLFLTAQHFNHKVPAFCAPIPSTLTKVFFDSYYLKPFLTPLSLLPSPPLPPLPAQHRRTRKSPSLTLAV